MIFDFNTPRFEKIVDVHSGNVWHGSYMPPTERGAKMQALQGLFQSRRFWTMVISIVVALALYFVNKYFGSFLPDVQFVINLITPLAMMVIAAFTIDDAIDNVLQTQREMHQASLEHEMQVYTAKFQAPTVTSVTMQTK